MIEPAAAAQAVHMGPDAQSVERIQDRLRDWYAQYGRDLPWRRTRDPYAILVAEVMLQQTQVERVVPKWHAWLARFPTLSSLAEASRADAIRAWQGLGYNMRAVRLHAIAQQAVAEFGGQLPADRSALQHLRGVGRYTASAIACFAFGQPVAMVETNIRRVLSRVFFGSMSEHAASAASLDQLAAAVVPREPGAAYAWNQALMDVGATLCRPRQPLCLVCPLLDACSEQHTTYVSEARRPRAAPPFESTERFVRGRILDALRELGPGESLAIDDLARLMPSRSPADLARSGGRLAADGLVAIDDGGRLRLPT